MDCFVHAALAKPSRIPDNFHELKVSEAVPEPEKRDFWVSSEHKKQVQRLFGRLSSIYGLGASMRESWQPYASEPGNSHESRARDSLAQGFAASKIGFSWEAL